MQVVQPREGIALRGFDDRPLLGQLDAAMHSGLHDLPGGVGLRDKVHRADLEALHLGALIRGQHNDGNVRELRLLLHPLQHFHAAHVRHLQIEKHDCDFIFVFLDLHQRFHAIGGVQKIPISLEHIAQHHPVDILVLHDEDVPLVVENILPVQRENRKPGSLRGVIPRDRSEPLQ